MKHIALAILTYSVAVLQTSSLHVTAIDPLLLLAALSLVVMNFEAAIVWTLLIGLTADLIGSGLSFGAVALVYVVVAFLIRTLKSQLHEQPVSVVAIALFVFVVAARLVTLLLATSVFTMDWSQSMLVIAVTWCCAFMGVATRNIATWLQHRMRKTASVSGAVGTPVGLEIR